MYNDQFNTLTYQESVEILRMAEKKKILESYTFPKNPSSDGYYHINLRDSTTKSGYKQLKAKTLDDLKEKVYGYEKGVCHSTIKTFKDVFEIVEKQKVAYIKDVQRKKSATRTIEKDNSNYKKFFSGIAFENKVISDITKLDIEHVALMNLQRYDLRKRAYKDMQSILRSVFMLAYQEEWIKENPFERANFDKYKKMCIESASIKERVHSTEDIEKMLDYVHEKTAKVPTYFPGYGLELQIQTGLRRGELQPLMWEDIVEFDGIKYLSICKEQLRDSSIVNHTKTNKNRLIPLSNKTVELLQTIKSRQVENGIQSIFIFPRIDDPTKCITYNTISHFYYRMLKKLGIEADRNFMKGTHAFRRTKATELRNKGVNPQIVANYLGHSNVVNESNYYTGGYDEDEILKVLNA